MEETIITFDKPSNPFPLNPPSRLICHVCEKQFSQYTCPRCNSRYCSLQCYKSHSMRCTESFMRENVVEEMGQLQPDDGTKQKMLDILKRFHSEEESDSMDEGESDSMYDGDCTLWEEAIQKIRSGGEVRFDDLSAEEKRQFQTAVASGKLSKMIEPWDPWWLKHSARTISLSRDGTRLIQPVNKHEPSASAQDGIENNQPTEVPLGPEAPLPPVTRLSSTKPSPLLAVHLVDIIYSYCFTLRIYNGDWKSDVIGSTTVVLSISSVLGQGGQPETVLEALSYCLEQTCSPAYRHLGGLQLGIGIVEDVMTLLSLGGATLVCLLCDMQILIQTSQRELKSINSRTTKIKRKLKSAERKVYFIMCWVHEQPTETWSSLQTIVRAEKAAIVNCYVNSKKPVRKGDGVETRSKALIEMI